MTEKELAEIEQRAKEGVGGIESEGGGPAYDAMVCVEEDIPALVAEVRKLRAALGRRADDQGYRVLSRHKLVDHPESFVAATLAEVADVVGSCPCCGERFVDWRDLGVQVHSGESFVTHKSCASTIAALSI